MWQMKASVDPTFACSIHSKLTISDQEVQIHIVQLESYHDEEVQSESSSEPNVTPVEEHILSFKFGL